MDGAKLAELRKQREMTQPQLAALAGLKTQQICDLEKGRLANPTLRTLTAIARALKMRPGELVDAVEAA